MPCSGDIRCGSRVCVCVCEPQQLQLQQAGNRPEERQRETERDRDRQCAQTRFCVPMCIRVRMCKHGRYIGQ